MRQIQFLFDGIPIDIFYHSCTGIFDECPPIFIAYKKWMGATMIHFFGLRIRIGRFK